MKKSMIMRPSSPRQKPRCSRCDAGLLPRAARLGAAVAFLTIPALVLAHHGVGAQFDLSMSIELQGEVERVIWRNPHVRIALRVTNEAGGDDLWEVEAQSVSMLRQRDITEVLLEVGDAITLAGNPARGGATEIYVTNVLLPDGREILFSQRAEPRWNDQAMGRTGPRFVAEGDTTTPELGLFRTWSSAPGQGLFRDFDVSNENFPLTDEARAAAAAYDRLTDNLATGECGSAGMPTIIGNPYPRDFIDQGDTILMRLEEYDAVRTIHLDENAADIGSPLGHSIGRWDNGTLVVTTTNISSRRFRLGIALSEDLGIVERYTPSDDGSRLYYQTTITDPATFLEPIEFQAYWIYIPGVTVEPYECIEG